MTHAIMLKGQVNSITDLSSLWQPSGEPDGYSLKVCVVTDSDASERSAVRMIQRVSKTKNLRLTLLHLDEFVSPSNGDNLAPAPLDSELFICAMSHGDELPGFARAWIERWACLCGEDHDCALVALVTSGSSPLDSRSPLVEYFEAIAAAREFAFIYGKSQDLVTSDSPQAHERAAHSDASHRMIEDRNPISERWGINE